MNGKPAEKLTASELREMLRNGAPGSRVELTIGSGSKAHKVTLVLRRLIPRKGGLKKAG